MYNLIVLGTFTVTRSCHHSQYEYEYLTDCGDGLKEGARTQSLAATPCMPMGPSVSHSVLASFPLSDAGKLRLSCSMYVPSFSFSDVVQSLSRVQLFAAPWTAARQASCPPLSPRACPNSCPLSGDTIQPSHPPSSPSPPAFNLSQHQGLFQRVSSLHQVTKVLELQLQHQSFH